MKCTKEYKSKSNKPKSGLFKAFKSVFNYSRLYCIVSQIMINKCIQSPPKSADKDISMLGSLYVFIYGGFILE